MILLRLGFGKDEEPWKAYVLCCSELESDDKRFCLSVLKVGAENIMKSRLPPNDVQEFSYRVKCPVCGKMIVMRPEDIPSPIINQLWESEAVPTKKAEIIMRCPEPQAEPALWRTLVVCDRQYHIEPAGCGCVFEAAWDDLFVGCFIDSQGTKYTFAGVNCPICGKANFVRTLPQKGAWVLFNGLKSLNPVLHHDEQTGFRAWEQ